MLLLGLGVGFRFRAQGLGLIGLIGLRLGGKSYQGRAPGHSRTAKEFDSVSLAEYRNGSFQK